MNFFAGNAAPITKVTFSSNQDAFESDNHSYIAAGRKLGSSLTFGHELNRN